MLMEAMIGNTAMSIGADYLSANGREYTSKDTSSAWLEVPHFSLDRLAFNFSQVPPQNEKRRHTHPDMGSARATTHFRSLRHHQPHNGTLVLCRGHRAKNI